MSPPQTTTARQQRAAASGYSRAFVAAFALHAAAATGAWFTVGPASARAEWSGQEAGQEEPATFEVTLSHRERPRATEPTRPAAPPIEHEAAPAEPTPAATEIPVPARAPDSLWIEGRDRPAAAPPTAAMPPAATSPEPAWLQPLFAKPKAVDPPATPPPSAAGGGFVAPSVVAGSNRPPPYPVTAYHHGWTGAVTVILEIDAEGNVTGAHVESSSGFSVLDDAALKQLHSWRFQPARDRGAPIRSTFRQQVVFRLVDGRPAAALR
jgi:protein TonB